MAKRLFCIESLPGGRNQFVCFSRSRQALQHSRHSPRSHHHHRRQHDKCEYIRVPEEEWSAALEREQQLRAANDRLELEWEDVKRSLQEREAEVARLAPLAARVPRLEEESQEARRLLAATVAQSERRHDEGERLRARVWALEQEKEGLAEQVRRLQRPKEGHVHKGNLHKACVARADELLGLLRGWRRRFEGSEEQCERHRRTADGLQVVVSDLEDRVRTFERILRRHGLSVC